MHFGDYVAFTGPDAYFRRLNAILVARDTQSWRSAFRGTEAAYGRFLRLPVAARLNARPASARFPLVAYSEGWNSSSQHDNTVLAEYLASHGYVVVSVPQVGELSSNLLLQVAPVDLEVQMRDLEFAIGVASALPFVDRNNLALAGWSMGGVTTLFMAARNPNVRAIVGLDPSYGARNWIDLVFRSPYFDIRRIRAPILALQAGNPASVTGQDTRVIDSLRLTDRYVGRVADVTHGDFSDFGMVASLFPVRLEDRTAEQASRGHEAVCRYVLAFLNAKVRHQRDALAAAAKADTGSIVSLRFMKGAGVQSEEELVAAAGRRGTDSMLQAVTELKRTHPGLEVIREPVMNSLGYQSSVKVKRSWRSPPSD